MDLILITVLAITLIFAVGLVVYDYNKEKNRRWGENIAFQDHWTWQMNKKETDEFLKGKRS